MQAYDYRIGDGFRFSCSQFFIWSGSSAKRYKVGSDADISAAKKIQAKIGEDFTRYGVK